LKLSTFWDKKSGFVKKPLKSLILPACLADEAAGMVGMPIILPPWHRELTERMLLALVRWCKDKFTYNHDFE